MGQFVDHSQPIVNHPASAFQVIDLTPINNRSERIKPTYLTVFLTVRSDVARRGRESTVRDDGAFDGLFLQVTARPFLQRWLGAHTKRSFEII